MGEIVQLVTYTYITVSTFLVCRCTVEGEVSLLNHVDLLIGSSSRKVSTALYVVM